MDIEIVEHDKGSLYTVNDKQVYKDDNNNWISPPSLTPFEKEMFMAYLRIRKP